MAENEPDRKRILDWTEGLLYFYGVVDFESLYREVAKNQDAALSRQQFKSILDQELKKKDSPREIIFEDGLYSHGEADYPRWLLEEQEKRPGISYRPVTAKEMHRVVSRQYSSLWPPAARELSERLQKQFGCSEKEAARRISFAQFLLKNGAPQMQLVELFLEDLDFGSFEALQPLVNLIGDLANHTPQWILKGWTSREIFERYEKPALRTLPAEPFTSGEEQLRIDSTLKVGRNEACPCGSGKKYKKCCGAPKESETVTPRARDKSGEGNKPSLEEWQALYEAAASFKEARCWEWMYNNDLFGVMDPETSEIVYCCIMGELGEHYGLGAYRGPEGLKAVIEIMESSAESPEFFFIQKCLMASFEDREILDREDRAVIKELGLKFRGRKQWPFFRSHEPGFHPWFIDDGECRFLTLILQQALQVSRRCRESKAILKHDHPGTFLVRVPRSKGRTIVWSDRYLEAAPLRVEQPTFKITDEVGLRRILTQGKRNRDTWEADTYFMPMPIQEKKGTRPYYPKVFLLFDKSRGLVLDHELMQDFSREGYRCIERFIGLIGRTTIPSRIQVEREETFYLLKEVCRRLNITLNRVEKLSAIPLIREELYDRIF